jgi:FkbM family methyltransferase
MTIKQNLLQIIQNTLSRSRTITLLAVKIKNQCNRIIIQRFGTDTMSPHLNGEYLILNHMAPICNSFFDVGSNKGEWTDHILNNTSAFYLYEPGTTAYDMCTTRFKSYQNVYVNNFALSDKAGKIEFYEQDNAGEMSSAIEKWANGPCKTIEVTTTTIDAELSRLNIDLLSYVKIDTEGFDLKVLQGAKQAIIHNKLGFIQFEYNHSWPLLGATLAEAYELLESNGYTLFLIKPDGLYKYDVTLFGEFYAFSNFIAIAPQNMPHVKPLIKGAA